MSKKFVIWGGYGGHNLGDEAILLALSRQLRREEPETRQIVLIPGGVSESTRAQYAAWGIEVCSGPRPFVYRVLFRARLIIGGGQMVDDSTPGWPVGWTSLLILINRLLGGSSIVVCIGAEPLSRRLASFLVRHVYSLAKIITCRDEASAQVLHKVGVPAEKVKVTRDVVFSLDMLRSNQDRAYTFGKVALVVAFDPNRIREKSDRLQSLIRGLMEKQIDVVLVAHDLRPGYDHVLVDEILTKFAENPRLTAFEGRCLNDVLELYKECDAVISGRMHPLILASLLGVLPIAYGGKAKVRSLLQFTSIPELGEGSPGNQAAAVAAFMGQRDQIVLELKQEIAGFRADVEQSFEHALSLYDRKAIVRGAFDLSS